MNAKFLTNENINELCKTIYDLVNNNINKLGNSIEINDFLTDKITANSDISNDNIRDNLVNINKDIINILINQNYL